MQQSVPSTAQMNGVASADTASMYTFPQNAGCYYPYYNAGTNAPPSGDPSHMAFYMNPQLFMTQFAQFMQMMGGSMPMPMAGGGVSMPMAGGLTMPMAFQQTQAAPVVYRLVVLRR